MPEERRSVSFRFPAEFMRLLAALKAKTGLSHTALIIMAVRELARKEGVE